MNKNFIYILVVNLIFVSCNEEKTIAERFPEVNTNTNPTTSTPSFLGQGFISAKQQFTQLVIDENSKTKAEKSKIVLYSYEFYENEQDFNQAISNNIRARASYGLGSANYEYNYRNNKIINSNKAYLHFNVSICDSTISLVSAKYDQDYLNELNQTSNISEFVFQKGDKYINKLMYGKELSVTYTIDKSTLNEFTSISHVGGAKYGSFFGMDVNLNSVISNYIKNVRESAEIHVKGTNQIDRLNLSLGEFRDFVNAFVSNSEIGNAIIGYETGNITQLPNTKIQGTELTNYYRYSNTLNRIENTINSCDIDINNINIYKNASANERLKYEDPNIPENYLNKIEKNNIEIKRYCDSIHRVYRENYDPSLLQINLSNKTLLRFTPKLFYDIPTALSPYTLNSPSFIGKLSRNRNIRILISGKIILRGEATCRNITNVKNDRFIAVLFIDATDPNNSYEEMIDQDKINLYSYNDVVKNFKRPVNGEINIRLRLHSSHYENAMSCPDNMIRVFCY